MDVHDLSKSKEDTTFPRSSRKVKVYMTVAVTNLTIKVLRMLVTLPNLQRPVRSPEKWPGSSTKAVHDEHHSALGGVPSLGSQ